MNTIENKIKSLSNDLTETLNSLTDINGSISLYSYGNLIATFATMENALLFAKYSFPNEDYYRIYDNKYALAH